MKCMYCDGSGRWESEACDICEGDGCLDEPPFNTSVFHYLITASGMKLLAHEFNNRNTMEEWIQNVAYKSIEYAFPNQDYTVAPLSKGELLIWAEYWNRGKRADTLGDFIYRLSQYSIYNFILDHPLPSIVSPLK